MSHFAAIAYRRLAALPCVLAASLSCTILAYAQTPAPAAPATPPPTSWIDSSTGHRVIRLTDEPGSSAFYFNVNAYTPSGKEMVYNAPDGIHVLDMETLKTRLAVPGHMHTIVVGRKTPSVFYINQQEHAIYSTNVDTGETKKLVQLPEHASIASINADETLGAGTYAESDTSAEYNRGPQAKQLPPLVQPLDKGQMMERRLAAHIPLVLFTIDLRTGKLTTLLRSTDWINHLLFSPTDPTLLMYCHEGPWHKVDRIWTIHTDGTHNTLIHKRIMQMEIAGHEFWGLDGKTIWYDLQLPRGEDFFLASYNLETGERTWYHMQRNEWSIHFNLTDDLSLFCGDGGDPGQVARAPDGEWIELFHPELIKNTGVDTPGLIHPGVFHSEHLVNMSKHNYRLEPNVRFSPDHTMVLFTSNMFGPSYVFGVQVAKAETSGTSPTDTERSRGN